MATRASSRPSVVVVGSINVDLILGVERLPGPGETVLGRQFIRQSGGKGANQAVAASKVGAAVTMLGAVGDDAFGRSAMLDLAGSGVDTSACRIIAEEYTGLALIVVDEAGENQIAVASGANARLDGRMIEAQVDSIHPKAGAVCLLGFEVGDEALVQAGQWAVANGLTVVVNPAPARPVVDELCALSPILTPNETEARLLTGSADVVAAAEQLSARTGAATIVTLGARGALLMTSTGAEMVPALSVESVDTTGAGDALNGIFASELARGRPVREALRWATVGASLKTTKSGAQAGLPAREEIADRLRSHRYALTDAPG